MSNGSDETDADDRVIQGTLIKCNDGHWVDRDGVAIPPDVKLLLLGTTSILQCWRDQAPIETIRKSPSEPLPKADDLNATIPVEKWEEGLDGKPRPPWQRQEVVYLLDPMTAEKFTFASGTTGARIAIANLRERVAMMKLLRGQDVTPIVTLSCKPMKTRFGGKLRPDFQIIEWREFNVGLTHEATPQLEHKPAVEPKTPPEPAKPKKPTGLKPVAAPTVAEELDDQLPPFA
jgi:hypothetical protein